MAQFVFVFLILELYVALYVALYFLVRWLFGPVENKVEAAIIRRGERRLKARLAELEEQP